MRSPRIATTTLLMLCLMNTSAPAQYSLETVGADLNSQPDAKSDLVQDLFQSGLVARIELETSYRISVSGTKYDDWIIVDQTLKGIHVEVRNLQSNNVVASLDFEAANVLELLVDGRSGNDRITNGTGLDSKILGGAGCDFIEGGIGWNRLYGGPDDDLIYSYGSSTKSFGEDGNDGIFSYWGDTEASGGNGEDFLSVQNGHAVFHGQAGDDVLLAVDSASGDFEGGSGSDVLVGGANTDFLWGDVRFSAQAGSEADLLYGNAGEDYLAGGGGNDVLIGGPGKDEMEGGPGNDWLYARDGTQDYMVYGWSGKDVFCVDDREIFDFTEDDSINCSRDPTQPLYTFNRGKFELLFGL